MLIIVVPAVKIWVQKPIVEMQKDCEKIKNELKLNRDMTFQTIYDRLVFLCTRYLEAGSINSEDLERLTDMYSAYEAAGGNHYAHNLYERVLDLPIRKEKK